MLTEASCALATQISLPSGETSNPSEPWPTGTVVICHDFWLPPWGGPPGPGPRPAPPPRFPLGAPGGGPKPPVSVACSMMLIVAELTFVVTILSNVGATQTIWVRS